MLSLTKIQDIHQCEDTDHVCYCQNKPAGHRRGPCGRPGTMLV